MQDVRTVQKGNKRKYTLKTFQSEFPQTKQISISKLNRAIFNCLSNYVCDKNVLATALLWNPFGKNTDYQAIKRDFGAGVVRSMQILKRHYAQDPLLIDRKCVNSDETTLFLVILRFMFNWREQFGEQTKKVLTKSRVAYAIKHLDCCYSYELRQELEDQFFKHLKPDIYQHYSYFLKFAKKTLEKREKEVRSALQKSFKKNGLDVEIRSRVKTVYSIHRKVVKKNILYSQVLDTVGLRLIVGKKSECYRVMEDILKQSPVIPSKIKDYIAVPKANGYQSIHLTIMYQRYPVEIQIRTGQMDYRAQFGSASHLRYKMLAEPAKRT